MLRYLDQSGTFVRMISEIEYSDLQITRTLSDGDKTLSFVYRGKYTDLSLEGYIETEDDSYVIKEIMPRAGASEYRCRLNIEPLEAGTIKQFTAQNKTISQAANAALVGTGWTCSVDSGISSKVRSVQQFNKTPFELLLKIRDAFMCEVKFDSIGKVVTFKEEFGSDKGVYLRPELNLVDVSLTLDSYDFYTRIIPIGADGLDIKSVNSGVEYVENYQYSTKVRTLYWEDTNYTDAQALKDDAIGKLADLSKPKRSYSASVRDLAKLSAEYDILDYDIGDTVTITDEPSGIRDKQRIVSITEYPEQPERNSVELSNKVLTWEEYQARLEAAANAWEDVSNADGSINGVYVHGVQADDVVKVQVDVNGQMVERNLNQAVGIVQNDIDSVNIRVGTVETTYLQATMANIDTANINTAKVKDLFVQVGLIRDAVIDGARITGYLDAVTVNAASITAGTLVADRIAIRGDTNALVYALNNYGQITSQEVDTLDGYILTDRTVNADKIVAHSITATEITTQNLIGTNGWINLSSGTFAFGVDKLTWDGTTLGVKGSITADAGNIGGFIVSNAANTGTSAQGGHIYTRSLYTHNSDTNYEYETGMKGDSSGPGALAFYIRRITKNAAWSTSSIVFAVTNAGSLTATAGTIGPWSITSTAIYKTSSTYGASTGMYFGDSGLSLTDKFKVSSAGALTATGVDIAGVITATSGKIGNWNISSASISATANNANTGNVERTTGLQWPGSGVWAIAVGATNSGSWVTAPFRVNHKGEMYSTSGKIGGWDIGAANISISPTSTRYVTLSDGTNSNADVIVVRNGAGTSADPYTYPFHLHATGAMTCTNATITGSITATSGKIGPWYIQSTGISSSSTSMSNASVLMTGKLALYSSSSLAELTTSQFTINGGGGVLTITSNGPRIQGFNSTDIRLGAGTGTSNNCGIYDYQAGGWIIAQNNQTRVTSLPYYTPSDIRIKSDINKSKVKALDILRQIDIVEFKRYGVYQPIGMISDWLEQLDPQFVGGGGYDEHGNMNIKYIDMFYLQGYLVKAIQELADKVARIGG